VVLEVPDAIYLVLRTFERVCSWRAWHLQRSKASPAGQDQSCEDSAGSRRRHHMAGLFANAQIELAS